MLSLVLFVNILIFWRIEALRLSTRPLQLLSRRQQLILPNTISKTKINCIGQDMTPIPPPTHEIADYWKTKRDPNVIPVHIDKKYTHEPKLITFDAINTIIEPIQSYGRWYREALNTVLEMRVRLPRPALFSKSYVKAFDDMYVFLSLDKS